MKYRAEIDGLRALSIISVILFHAGIELFEGGFVGVDIFFVISAYLITTILIVDIENKKFSLITFYEKRARRILPALFFVMACCIPLAWMWMLPSQLKDFSQSIVAVSLFASNVLFWRESGYFSPSAEEKPLLHTWSLAVEEQYYVLFPIFLILAWRFGERRVFSMIIFLAATSLLLSEYGWRNQPTANFYLAPTRAWELFAGSIAALIAHKHGIRKNNTLTLLGLFAICFAILFYDKTIPFPSVYTLMPVLGVMLILLHGDQQTLVAKLLSTKALVSIGLISYSAYLWHQPLFAFTRIRLDHEPSTTLMLGLTFITFLLAYITWKYIETPFRDLSILTRKSIYAWSLCGCSVFLLLGASGHFSNGFVARLPNNLQKVATYFEYDYATVYDEGGCFLKIDQSFRDIPSRCYQNNDVVIWGDSFSAALASGLNGLKLPFSQFSASACPPIVGLRKEERPNCEMFNYDVLNQISVMKPATVFLIAEWRSLDVKEHHKIAETILLLKSLGTQEVFVIGNLPVYRPSLPEFYMQTYRSDLQDWDRRTSAEINVSIANDTLISELAEVATAQFLDAIQILCNANSCKVANGSIASPILFIWDYGHFTKAGAEYLWRAFIREIPSIKNSLDLQ